MTRRICSRHYGMMLSRPFNPDLEVRDERVYYSHFHGKDYREGWIEWQIQKAKGSIAVILSLLNLN